MIADFISKNVTADSSVSSTTAAIIGAVAAVAAAAIVGALSYLAQRQVLKQQQKASRQQLAQQSLLFKQQLKEQRETSERQLESAHQQLAVLREGQITERITRAIEQLGSDKTDVRLGGVLALERVVESSPEEWRLISEVLTAYVQTHAPWPPRSDGQPPETTNELSPLRTWAPDVQAVMTVLARRGPFPGGQRLNLISVDLRMVDLPGARLPEALFRQSCLQRAILTGADLKKADFARSKLQGADLRDAHLEGARLRRCKLWKADLGGAHLDGADLEHIEDLDTAILDGAYLLEATATQDTTWPPGFDPAAHGVIKAGP
jgi:hypothetical protein